MSNAITPPIDKICSDLEADARFLCTTHAGVVGAIGHKYSAQGMRQSVLTMGSAINDLNSGDVAIASRVGNDERLEIYEHALLTLEDASRGGRLSYNEIQLLRALPNVEAGVDTLNDPVLDNPQRQVLVDLKPTQKIVQQLYEALTPYAPLVRGMDIAWRMKGQGMREVLKEIKPKSQLREATWRLEAVEKAFHAFAPASYKPDAMHAREYGVDIYALRDSYKGNDTRWQDLMRVDGLLDRALGEVDYYSADQTQKDHVKELRDSHRSRVMPHLDTLQRARPASGILKAGGKP